MFACFRSFSNDTVSDERGNKKINTFFYMSVRRKEGERDIRSDKNVVFFSDRMRDDNQRGTTDI